MTKVVALRKGFHQELRVKGDVFVVPFSEEVVKRCSWLALAGTPVPADRVIPTNRNATMMDVIKGVASEEEDLSEPVDTMSAMTKEHFESQLAHPRAHGLPPAEPQEKKPKKKKPYTRQRKQRSDKGVKRGPRAVKKTEEVAL